MLNLIVPASNEDGFQVCSILVVRQPVYLGRVVPLDKRLDRIDGRVYRISAEECRNKTGGEPRYSPRQQQAAPIRDCHQIFD